SSPARAAYGGSWTRLPRLSWLTWRWQPMSVCPAAVTTRPPLALLTSTGSGAPAFPAARGSGWPLIGCSTIVAYPSAPSCRAPVVSYPSRPPGGRCARRHGPAMVTVPRIALKSATWLSKSSWPATAEEVLGLVGEDDGDVGFRDPRAALERIS